MLPTNPNKEIDPPTISLATLFLIISNSRQKGSLEDLLPWLLLNQGKNTLFVELLSSSVEFPIAVFPSCAKRFSLGIMMNLKLLSAHLLAGKCGEFGPLSRFLWRSVDLSTDKFVVTSTFTAPDHVARQVDSRRQTELKFLLFV